MPFATWDLDRAFVSFVHAAAHAIARAENGVVSGMGPMESSSSTASSVVSGPDGTELDLPSRRVGYSMTADFEAIRIGDLEALAVEIDAAAEELGKEMVKLFIDSMDKVTEFTGNVIDVGGPLTFDHFYAMMDQIEWSLDDDDELVRPSLIAHPDTAKNLPNPTESQAAALRDLENRKRQELLARRRRRRLS